MSVCILPTCVCTCTQTHEHAHTRARSNANVSNCPKGIKRDYSFCCGDGTVGLTWERTCCIHCNYLVGWCREKGNIWGFKFFINVLEINNKNIYSIFLKQDVLYQVNTHKCTSVKNYNCSIARQCFVKFSKLLFLGGFFGKDLKAIISAMHYFYKLDLCLKVCWDALMCSDQ